VEGTRRINQKTAAAVFAEGGRTLEVVAELPDPNSCEKAIKEVINQLGKIDGLVNNAGVNDGVGLETVTIKTFCPACIRMFIHYYLMPILPCLN
jgi:L-fucose dehydrogenase